MNVWLVSGSTDRAVSPSVCDKKINTKPIIRKAKLSKVALAHNRLTEGDARGKPMMVAINTNIPLKQTAIGGWQIKDGKPS